MNLLPIPPGMETEAFAMNSGANGSRSLPHQPVEPSIAGPRVLNIAV